MRDHLTWVEPITGMVLPSPDDAEADAADAAACDRPGARPDDGAQIEGDPP
ncbi:hypothetical protein ACRAWG_06615 [Methylobacterium sp. P31]